MTLNPITALSEQLQKLINEHGSAAILRDHLALFKDQAVLLEKKNIELTTKNAELMSKITVLETEITFLNEKLEKLTKDNEKLRAKIQNYEQPAHNNPLDEVKVKILLFLSSNNECTSEKIARFLNIDSQVIKFHLEKLKKSKMIKYKSYFPSSWYLTQEGRKYLIENKLIS